MAVQMSVGLLGDTYLTKREATRQCDAMWRSFHEALKDKGEKFRNVASKMLYSDCVTIGSWNVEYSDWPEGPVAYNKPDGKLAEYQQIFALPDDNAKNIQSLLFA